MILRMRILIITQSWQGWQRKLTKENAKYIQLKVPPVGLNLAPHVIHSDAFNLHVH